MSDFQKLGLSQAVTASLARAGFDKPTPIQSQSIPLALEGHDIMGLAQTGTGKTLAFGLPMIDLLLARPKRPAPKTVHALVLAPTRELVSQIAENLKPLVQSTPLRVATVVGGQSMNRQIATLSKGVDILIATPGRLIDLMDQGHVTLSTVRFLVLDEADQMLDMGFIHALRKIAPRLGSPRQTMLFSATMPKPLEVLSQSYLTDPKRVQVAPPGKTADKIEQSVLFMEIGEKKARLREILSSDLGALTLVFTRTKRGAERMSKDLIADGFNAASIHGNKSQNQRDRAIRDFRAGDVTVLVATDVAARGIDIPGVARVINYDLPNVAESYVHRIGRTARAGREGEAVAFCSPDEVDLLRAIEKLIGRSFGAPAAGGKPAAARKPAAERPDGKPRRSRRRRTKPAQNGAANAVSKPAGNGARKGRKRAQGGGGDRRSSGGAA